MNKYQTLTNEDKWQAGDEVAYGNSPHIPREWFSVVEDYFGERVGMFPGVGRRPIKEPQPVAEHGG